MNGHLLALYVAAVFLAMIAPGPDMMFVLATGARGGPRAGLLAALGAATSEIVRHPRRSRARQALDAGSGTIMVVLAGRLALEAR